MKALLGLTLAFAIGFACKAFGIPSPAPPVTLGALLVVAMTTGYLLVDRWMARPAQHAADCGGPSGLTPSVTASSRCWGCVPRTCRAAWSSCSTSEVP